MQNSLKLTLNKSMTASLQWNSTWHQLMLFASILPSLLLEVLPFLFSSVVRSNSLRFMVHVARVVLGRTHICHTTLPRFSSSSLFRWEAHLFQQQQLVWGTPNQSLSMVYFLQVCKPQTKSSPVSSRPNLDHPNQDQGIDDASSTRQQGSGRSISCSILHLDSYWRIDCPGKIMNPRKTVQ